MPIEANYTNSVCSSSAPSIEVPTPELSIALHKGTRSYTIKHSIAGVFSFSYHFTTYSILSSVLVPTSSPKALRDPGWKKAMDDEMPALHHN